MIGRENRGISALYQVYDSGLPNESPIFRNLLTKDINGGKLIPSFRNQPTSLRPINLLQHTAQKHPNKKALGERLVDATGAFGRYSFITYSEFYQKVRIFARGLASLGVGHASHVVIYSQNCILWQISSFAVNQLGAILIPITSLLPTESDVNIINQTKTHIAIIGKDQIDNMLPKIKQCKCLKKIVCIGFEPPEDFEQNAIEIFSTKQIFEFGNKFSSDETQKQSEDDVAMIMFTSGTTVTPKGCILTNKNLIAGASGLATLGTSITTIDVFLSFLPLSHIYGFEVELIMVAAGAAIGFSSGNPKEILDDIKALRPTVLCGVPRFWKFISDQLTEYAKKLSPIMQAIYQIAVEAKSDAFKRNEEPSLFADMTVFAPFKAILGGRVRLLVSGGAPMLPDVYNTLKLAITPNIVQGYGLTEASGCVSLQAIPATISTGVGIVAPCCELKLRSVQRMQYSPRDNPMSGEILIRGPNVFKGYFKGEISEESDQQKVNGNCEQSSLEDGWLATGDIGLITSTGDIQILDRISNLVKLSHGEYISIITLTKRLKKVEGVKSIFVYADSHFDAPAAVVVPTERLLKLWAARGITNASGSTAAAEDMRKRLAKGLEGAGALEYEKISQVLIETEDFGNDTNQNVSEVYRNDKDSFQENWQMLRKKFANKLIELLQ